MFVNLPKQVFPLKDIEIKLWYLSKSYFIIIGKQTTKGIQYHIELLFLCDPKIVKDVTP